jgi:predicted dienelactone hydrolase
VTTASWTIDAPVPVVSTSPVMLRADDARGADLEIRVSAPMTGRELPVLIFAHGFAQSSDGYVPLAHYWAARGFVVVQPTFLDSWRYGLPKDDLRTPSIWQHRADDVTNVLDHLELIETIVPSLGGRVDRERILIAGHSFGAHTAGLLLGARVRAADGVMGSLRRDERIKAAVLLSTAGRGGDALSAFARESLPYLDQDFSEVTTKTLVVAGDRDVSPLTVLGPEWFTDAYTLMPGATTLVTLFGAEHMLGGIDGMTGHGPNESLAQVVAVQRLTWAWARTALYPRDRAWPVARAELSARTGRVDEKT